MERKTNHPNFISLIIPAYKQERTIQRDIKRIEDVMNQLRYEYEIVIVVDGFLDHTYEKVKEIVSSKIKVVGYERNQGKGHAVRFGMAKAKGDVIVFLDSGMDINPNGISMLLEAFEWNDADIVVGSKLHPDSKVNYPNSRKVLSWGYRVLNSVLFGLSIRDSQVGIKLFKRKVLLDVLPRLLVKRFAFDIEILAVANYLGYKKIVEAPIELDFTGASSITSKNFIITIYHMLNDTLAVFYRLKIIHYYDTTNKKNWKQDPELSFTNTLS